MGRNFSLANVGGRAALVDDGHWYDLETVSGGWLDSDPMRALDAPESLAELSATLDTHEPQGLLVDAELGAPVPRPRNVYAIGLNYAKHAAEGGMELPERPLVFTKFPSCLVGPRAEVELRSEFVDYEGELVVVIGRSGRDIAVEDAWEHVVGLTVGQDISDRVVQFAAKPPHFDLGKSFDTFGPIGPVVVSPSAFDDPTKLDITTEVNGEVRQHDSTESLVFDVASLISYLSRVTTLSCGDLIFTGTPEGIGAADGRFLRDGDVVRTTIGGIGSLENRCVRIGDHDVA